MNTTFSPQDIVQAQLAAGQGGAGLAGTGSGNTVPESGDASGGSDAPSPQLLQALHQAADANDLNAFNSLLRSASKQRAGRNPNSAAAGQNPQALSQAQAQAQGTDPRLLALAQQQARLAAMQPGAGGLPANAAQAMAAAPGGMNMPANGRTTPPFMPQRLDRFESFLGNFIGALGEGMSIQQAARATLRNLRAQQMLQSRLAAQAMQAQQLQQAQLLRAQAAQAGLRNPAQPAGAEPNHWKQLAMDLMHHIHHSKAAAGKGNAGIDSNALRANKAVPPVHKKNR